MVECLQQETAQFGIQSVIFEPGYYRSNIFSPTKLKTAPSRIAEYEETEKALAGFIAATDGNQPGDPRKLVERIIDVVKSEGMAAGKAMPPRLPMGRDAMAIIVEKCEATLQICKEWENLITSTDIETSELS